MSTIRFDLRPYQSEAIERIQAAEARGVRRQLGVAATGLGKTVIFCALAAERGGRTLILAHRDELVSQAVHKVREIWPEVDVGIVKAEQNDVTAQVIVASVQTLSRQKRLDELLNARDSLIAQANPFDLVVVDEAHHAPAETYVRVLDALDAGADDGPLLLGVTATPDRGDDVGLVGQFDEVVWHYDILWGIRSGWLADVQAKRIVLDEFDINDVRVRRGDYDAGMAGQALEDAHAPELILQSWIEHARDRQTLVFTPTVALADLVAARFRDAGIRAAMLSGATPLEERRGMLRLYAEGELQVIANCAVLTEGFDEPRTDCIVVARPTKSRALFTQMVGRGTRRHPEKDNLLVLDVVGASNQHSLITVPSLFGLNEEVAAEVETRNLTEAVDDYERRQVKLGRMRAEEADLFRRVRAQGITWIRVGDVGRRYERDLSYRNQSGVMVPNPKVVLVQRVAQDPDSWLCGIQHPDGQKDVLMSNTTLEMAQSVGEDYARKTMGHRITLISTDAKWRRKKPSKAAIAAAVKWRVRNVDQYQTAGELSDAIDARIAQVRARAS